MSFSKTKSAKLTQNTKQSKEEEKRKDNLLPEKDHFLNIDKNKLAEIIALRIEIEKYIKNAEKILCELYSNPILRNLQKSIRSSVDELMSIQNEINAVVVHIKSLIKQIHDVEDNLADNKIKLKYAKKQDKRVQFLLERQKRNNTRLSHSDERVSPTGFFLENDANLDDREYSRDIVPFNRQQSMETIKKMASIRNNTLTKRITGVQFNRSKINRPKSQLSLAAQHDSTNGDITLELNPIIETNSNDSSQTVRSNHDISTTSSGNINWLSAHTSPSQHTTNTVSTAGSLFVFDSSSDINEID